jgi:hypothetical protein
MTQVFWRSMVDKQLERVPEVITRKFRLWVALVEESGIREGRKHKGWRWRRGGETSSSRIVVEHVQVVPKLTPLAAALLAGPGGEQA